MAGAFSCRLANRILDRPVHSAHSIEVAECKVIYIAGNGEPALGTITSGFARHPLADASALQACTLQRIQCQLPQGTLNFKFKGE